jgi:hypothetical protein
MRALAALMMILALGATPAIAGTGGAADPGSAAANANSAPAAKENAAGSPAAPATPATPATPAQPAPAGLENQIQQLRDLLDAQSRQLQMQNEQLKEQQAKMLQMEEQLKNVNDAVGNDGNGLASDPASIGALGFNNDQGEKGGEPIAIHYKGVTLTPGGFFAAESAYRQRAVVGDVNTDFKGIPLPGASAANLGEINLSGRQSRIAMKIEGKLSDVKLTGYYEADFLGAGVTSNNNQTNSYVFRQRQFWGQAAWDSGWKITGGQMWSLATEDRHGLDNLSEFIPATIDAQYQVGFTWARQYGLRITKNFGDKFWLGLSVEGSQTTFGGVRQNDSTLIAAPGDLAGLFNNQANYSFNETPDFIVKAAWEPTNWSHYEVFGIVSTFRARIFPCAGASANNPCPLTPATPTTASAVGAFNDTNKGGGGGANARWWLFNRHVDFGLHFLGGPGVGRYGTTSLADVTARPDGTLIPIRSYQALGSLELHPTPKLDIYLYAGSEYDQRTTYTFTNPAGNHAVLGVGYGSPLNSNAGCLTEIIPGNQNTPGALGSCEQDIRDIIEGTAGFWYRFYAGPRGRMQFGAQYSYVTRGTWSAKAGGDPHAVDNMIFTSLRYYLP